jgi:GR25 family glycosyltransferase involved in LPS biosynthesis
MLLKEYFDHIYCINLDRRPDKWKNCLLEFEKHDIVVERITAIDGNPNNEIKNEIKEPYVYKPGIIGCALSHLKIVKDALENNYKNILILEDDIVFEEEVNYKFSEYINKIPLDWQLLYFGGNHLGEHFTEINDNVFKITNTYTTHCIGMKNEFFKKFIARVELSIDYPIDVIYAELQKSNSAYCFKPHLAWQRKGFSDIDNAYVDYDIIIKEFKAN